MHLPTLSHCFAPDDGRVTAATEETHGRTHRRPPGSFMGTHTEGRTEQATGTGTQQETHGSHGTHNRQQERRTSGGKARKGGERNTDGRAPGGAMEEGNEEETRQQGESRERADRQKKVCNIFKGEKREKRRRDSQTHVNVCIYILPNIVAWWLFIALSFIYYKGVYYIYLYILYNPD